VSLHDARGVPMRSFGTGSSRLLAAGLQARAAGERSVTLIDELEHGLEPYRVTRLLHHLGAKATGAGQQVFLTTHSPVVLRELSAAQIRVVRRHAATGTVQIRDAGSVASGQALLRACPKAFLSPSVLVCEGKTEQGLVRGLDLHRSDAGKPSMGFMGAITCDGHGYPSVVTRALALQALGYRVAILRDSDQPAVPEEAELVRQGGRVFHWEEGNHAEAQLAKDLPLDAMTALLSLAVREKGADAIRDHLRNAGVGSPYVAAICVSFPEALRAAVGKAAGKGSWFKNNMDCGEAIGRTVVGPNLGRCGGGLRSTLVDAFAWMEQGIAVT
jgi:hypothetical protein